MEGGAVRRGAAVDGAAAGRVGGKLELDRFRRAAISARRGSDPVPAADRARRLFHRELGARHISHSQDGRSGVEIVVQDTAAFDTYDPATQQFDAEGIRNLPVGGAADARAIGAGRAIR